ncbi:hypothetical protein NDU88_002782 [Pleurodeles waltl]|uniref:Uncharacterized protein n=1 Tax=Pleurodeles waltl TaxID=8319 RepID=A0AAV7SBI3_PLEWA|nr:hypothetical protein NDU88_002782 [Pleurodeles waltl]
MEQGGRAPTTGYVRKPPARYREERELRAKALSGKQDKASLGWHTELELDEDLEALLNKARELLPKQHRDRTTKRNASPFDQDLPKKRRSGLGTTPEKQPGRGNNSAPHKALVRRVVAARMAPPPNCAANRICKEGLRTTAAPTAPPPGAARWSRSRARSLTSRECEESSDQGSEDDQVK